MHDPPLAVDQAVSVPGIPRLEAELRCRSRRGHTIRVGVDRLDVGNYLVPTDDDGL
jgi:hypothetical protein